MAIHVRDSSEFKRVIEAIALELVDDDNIAFQMHADLIAAYETDRRRRDAPSVDVLEPANQTNDLRLPNVERFSLREGRLSCFLERNPPPPQPVLGFLTSVGAGKKVAGTSNSSEDAGDLNHTLER